jgi:hypothetical protein
MAPPPALVGLLWQLPDVDDGWTDERRAGFIRAFTLVLDISIPVTNPPTSADQRQGNEGS